MDKLNIRQATANDMDVIATIYAEEVLHGLSTFETEPPDAAELTHRWQTLFSKGFPYLVATQDDLVIAYAYAGPYRMRVSYQYSIENSIYVEKTARGKGVGKLLLSSLITECEKGTWRQLIAVIGDSDNAASISLHKSVGFRVLGNIEAVGFKHDRWVDTVFMQRALGDGSSTKPEN